MQSTVAFSLVAMLRARSFSTRAPGVPPYNARRRFSVSHRTTWLNQAHSERLCASSSRPGFDSSWKEAQKSFFQLCDCDHQRVERRRHKRTLAAVHNWYFVWHVLAQASCVSSPHAGCGSIAVERCTELMLLPARDHAPLRQCKSWPSTW